MCSPKLFGFKLGSDVHCLSEQGCFAFQIKGSVSKVLCWREIDCTLRPLLKFWALP